MRYIKPDHNWPKHEAIVKSFKLENELRPCLPRTAKVIMKLTVVCPDVDAEEKKRKRLIPHI